MRRFLIVALVVSCAPAFADEAREKQLEKEAAELKERVARAERDVQILEKTIEKLRGQADLAAKLVEAARPAIVADLSSPDPVRRRAALQLATLAGLPEAAQALEPALASQDPLERLEACRTLLALGRRDRAIPVLTAAVNDASRPVLEREAALSVLVDDATASDLADLVPLAARMKVGVRLDLATRLLAAKDGAAVPLLLGVERARGETAEVARGLLDQAANGLSVRWEHAESCTAETLESVLANVAIATKPAKLDVSAAPLLEVAATLRAASGAVVHVLRGARGAKVTVAAEGTVLQVAQALAAKNQLAVFVREGVLLIGRSDEVSAKLVETIAAPVVVRGHELSAERRRAFLHGAATVKSAPLVEMLPLLGVNANLLPSLQARRREVVEIDATASPATILRLACLELGAKGIVRDGSVFLGSADEVAALSKVSSLHISKDAEVQTLLERRVTIAPDDRSLAFSCMDLAVAGDLNVSVLPRSKSVRVWLGVKDVTALEAVWTLAWTTGTSVEHRWESLLLGTSSDLAALGEDKEGPLPAALAGKKLRWGGKALKLGDFDFAQLGVPVEMGPGVDLQAELVSGASLRHQSLENELRLLLRTLGLTWRFADGKLRIEKR